jgi:ElaB/YqjD/DUF883 family membrane-anchored ribosome-binding protein
MNNDTQNFAKDTQQMVDRNSEKANQMVAKAADKADQMIDATKEAASNAEHSIQGGLNQIREAVPAGLSRAAHQAEDLARAGINKARAAGQSVAGQASHMREQTVSYVREEPTKALLMAVAAGAFATLLIGWATRGNGHSRH